MRKDTSKKIRTAAFLSVLVAITTLISCKKDKVTIITPDIPEEVLPVEVQDSITKYMNIYEGTTPPHLNGQFLSKPHILIHASYDNSEDSTFYNERYIAFVYSEENGLDFYGKQWDDSIVNPQGGYGAFYEEHVSKMKITGTGDNFSCYYETKGYPDGMFARQSTIFSGIWDEKVGIIDFKVAVMLIETSGNPNLEPEGSFRVLGDYDGVAEINNWMGKSSESRSCDSSDAFNMFRKKR